MKEEVEIQWLSPSHIELTCEGTRYVGFAATHIWTDGQLLAPIGVLHPVRSAYAFDWDQSRVLAAAYVAEKFRVNNGIDADVLTLMVGIFLHRPVLLHHLADELFDATEWAIQNSNERPANDTGN